MAFQKRKFNSRGRSRPHNNYRNGSSGGRRSGNRIRYMRVDPRILIKKAEPQLEQKIEIKHTFAEFGLNRVILQNIANKGYKKPTPIQDQVIAEIMKGRDVLGLASTGTGKTAAFLLPIIDKIVRTPREKVIIITPTRELALQIRDEGESFARNLRCHFSLVIGGVNIKRQIRELRRNPHVIVGTPGRIKDLTERRELKLSDYRTIVLDEVDRMLDMGFVCDVSAIVSKLPSKRHSLFFFSDDVRKN